MDDLTADLLDLVDASPSPYHAVDALRGRLEAAGFAEWDERAPWSPGPGDAGYVVRDGGSLVAVRVGRQSPADAGIRLIGAHTDSPTYAVRPRSDIRRHGYTQVGVEPYGSPLAHTWVDRDLGLAGRVTVQRDGRMRTVGVHLDRPLLRIPSLAIHLTRGSRDEGLQLNPHAHMVPVSGGLDAPALAPLLADALDVAVDDVLSHDLVTTDLQPAALGGIERTAILAPRLDNLLSCHASVRALCAVEGGAGTQILVANDHEEVGSGSAEGARGTFLSDVIARVVEAVDGPGVQPRARALARSLLVSCDGAHAVHPNYADRHDAEHRPQLGGGPVIKHNAGQSYASDATSAGALIALARGAGVDVQHFVSRADQPCGSTIGPLTATRVGVQTVDIGSPMLSMHSCREQAHSGDVAPLVALLTAHLSADPAD